MILNYKLIKCNKVFFFNYMILNISFDKLKLNSYYNGIKVGQIKLK